VIELVLVSHDSPPVSDVVARPKAKDFARGRNRSRVAFLMPPTHAVWVTATTLVLTIHRCARTLSSEVELTIRFFNSHCSSMARPFYLATALRAEVRVSRSTTQGWINRHSGALDSGKEGEAP
jgi:hypothetical protein